MLRRSSPLATAATIILITLVISSRLPFAVALAPPGPPPPNHDPRLPNNDSRQPPEAICRPFGLCEPCPKEELHQPFCQPFGNRRVMHCTTTTTPPHSSSSSSGSSGSFHHGQPPHHNPPRSSSFDHPVDHAGETPAWESCGRIVSQEHADFWEFVACNVFFALVSLVLVVVRSRRMHALQTRQIAARIGLVRSSARHV